MLNGFQLSLGRTWVSIKLWCKKFWLEREDEKGTFRNKLMFYTDPNSLIKTTKTKAVRKTLRANPSKFWDLVGTRKDSWTREEKLAKPPCTFPAIIERVQTTSRYFSMVARFVQRGKNKVWNFNARFFGSCALHARSELNFGVLGMLLERTKKPRRCVGWVWQAVAGLEVSEQEGTVKHPRKAN